jgi:uncharacterized protein (DUF2249 family)
VEDKIGKTITPETKVAQLLKEFPNLEECLIKIAPAFSKLRNPVLKKTIAKVTSLRQAAKIADMPVAKIINILRKEAGLPAESYTDNETTEKSKVSDDWTGETKIVKSLDARPLLESGAHPMAEVMAELKKLNPGESFELITPFIPAPLIEMAESKGYQAISHELEPELVKTYFRLQP